jgi:hypothetical protein
MECFPSHPVQLSRSTKTEWFDFIERSELTGTGISGKDFQEDKLSRVDNATF